MSVILQVNYTASPQQLQRALEDRLGAARKISELPGFVWKVWIGNDAQARRGGIYLFESLEAAEAWGRQVEPRLLAGGGTDVELRYFDIDREPSLVNHAPLG